MNQSKNVLENSKVIIGKARGASPRRKKAIAIVLIFVVLIILGIFLSKNIVRLLPDSILSQGLADIQKTNPIRYGRILSTAEASNTSKVQDLATESSEAINKEELALFEEQFKNQEGRTITNYISAATLAKKIGNSEKKEEYLKSAEALLTESTSDRDLIIQVIREIRE